jgi:pSer/pThr/pTyr-binding forkhead associated (FHA) protein
MTTHVILTATVGPLNGLAFALGGEGQAVLGRSHDCWPRLAGDITVSRQHCLIEVDEAGAWVRDLGSLNGTYLNGKKIGARARRQGDATMVQPPRRPLHDGDELCVGTHAFRVETAACCQDDPLLCGASI